MLVNLKAMMLDKSGLAEIEQRLVATMLVIAAIGWILAVGVRLGSTFGAALNF
jgi:hypothetical protein